MRWKILLAQAAFYGLYAPIVSVIEGVVVALDVTLRRETFDYSALSAGVYRDVFLAACEFDFPLTTIQELSRTLILVNHRADPHRVRRVIARLERLGLLGVSLDGRVYVRGSVVKSWPEMASYLERTLRYYRNTLLREAHREFRVWVANSHEG